MTGPRGAPQAPGQPVGVHCGRCRQQRQLGPQRRPDVDQERQREVGVEVPLVALVQHHGRRTRQFRIALQPAQQDPGSHHLDPGASDRPDARPVPRSRPDPRPVRRPARPSGGPPPGPPPGAARDHDPAGERVGQRQRDQCGLAGARRRHQDRAPTARKRPTTWPSTARTGSLVCGARPRSGSTHQSAQARWPDGHHCRRWRPSPLARDASVRLAIQSLDINYLRRVQYRPEPLRVSGAAGPESLVEVLRRVVAGAVELLDLGEVVRRAPGDVQAQITVEVPDLD